MIRPLRLFSGSLFQSRITEVILIEERRLSHVVADILEHFLSELEGCSSVLNHFRRSSLMNGSDPILITAFLKNWCSTDARTGIEDIEQAKLVD